VGLSTRGNHPVYELAIVAYDGPQIMATGVHSIILRDCGRLAARLAASRRAMILNLLAVAFVSFGLPWLLGLAFVRSLVLIRLACLSVFSGGRPGSRVLCLAARGAAGICGPDGGLRARRMGVRFWRCPLADWAH
jgi:hypothetical protein